MSIKTNLENFIKERELQAAIHSEKCKQLTKNKSLINSINYCKKQGIEPPQCSLTSDSKYADSIG